MPFVVHIMPCRKRRTVARCWRLSVSVKLSAEKLSAVTQTNVARISPRRGCRLNFASVGEVLKVIGDCFCDLGVVRRCGAVVVPFALPTVGPGVNGVLVCPVIAEADRDLVNLALAAVQHRDADRRVVFRNPQGCEGCLDRRGLRQAGDAGSADQLYVLQQADLCGHLLEFGFKKVHGGFLRVVYSGRAFRPSVVHILILNG